MAYIQKLNNMHEYKRESKAFVASKILEKVPHDILENRYVMNCLKGIIQQ